MRPITVQFYKYPDRLHWRHDTTYLGEDEHGIWLGSQAGSIVQRGHESPVEHPYRFVSVIAPGAWYIPIFSPDDHRYAIYVDISSPTTWTTPDRVEMFDLDLDVILSPEGRVEILDRDEFEDHSVRFGYPEHLIVGAEAATAFVFEAVSSRHGPFSGVASQWLDHLADIAG